MLQGAAGYVYIKLQHRTQSYNFPLVVLIRKYHQHYNVFWSCLLINCISSYSAETTTWDEAWKIFW